MMTDQKHAELVDILYVEDSAGDVRLMKEALKGNGARNALHVAEDGEHAMAFLRREGKYANSPRPGLVLLDLNLPRMDGREVLAAVKTDPRLKTIPVVVITSSKAEEDIVNSYLLHANAYVTKPVDLSQFLAVVKTIKGFWMDVVTLPPGAET